MREATNKILEMVEEGLIDKDYLILACLKYMSEDSVADMARINELTFEDEKDEEEWTPYNADYCDKGSYHHY